MIIPTLIALKSKSRRKLLRSRSKNGSLLFHSISSAILFMDSPTHKVDCYKNKIALEIEWNNKDPFFDRDLNNFRLLFDLRAISVGIIITRSDHLQNIFVSLGRGSSYGQSTTHMSKLLPRIEGGSGGGCPILVFGITKKLYSEDS